METPKIIIVNCETGESSERDMTAEELAQRELDSQNIPPVLEAS
jgi:hypothetical protein